VKTEYIFGIHSVHEALLAGHRQFFALYHQREGKSTGKLQTVIHLAESIGIPCHITPGERLTSLAGSRSHQGLVGRVSRFVFQPPQRLSHILAGGTSSPILLLLDSILDPNNLGALIRTACCTGVSAVIIPKNRSAGPTPTVSKISAGALEHVQIFQVTNLTETIRSLKSEGLWIMGMQKDAPKSVFQTDLRGPVGIVIGGEQKGIRPLIKQNCDFLVSIPQAGPIDSLNASAAGAVVLYEVFRQRIRKKSAVD